MKKNVACLLACLCLTIALLLPWPVATADLPSLDPALLPEDTIAIAISPANNDQPRIIYAVYGVIKDEETLSVSVRQISTDPGLIVYEEDVTNVDGQTLRRDLGFSEDDPIVGTYCDAYLINGMGSENPNDWIYWKESSFMLHSNYLDEQFTFLLSELGDMDEKLTLRLNYNCIPTPGTLDGHPLCLMTIDLSDYLK